MIDSILKFLIPESFRQNKAFLLSILKWTLIGLLIRLVIMPFTMASDMQYINYMPHRLVTYGTWDPYTYARQNFADKVLFTRDPYYPPLNLYLISFFQFFLQKFMPTIKDYFLNFEAWWRLGAGPPLERFALGGTSQIFRTLFLLKIPLLFFDYGIAFLLLRLVRNIKEASFIYKLWMLNPVILFETYAVGQLDIYPTFFVVLALVFSLKDRPNLAMVSLTLGVLSKTYPILLLPVAAIYMGKSKIRILKLLLVAAVTFFVVFLPSLLASHGYSLISIYFGSIGTSVRSHSLILVLMKVMFVLGFIYILWHIYKQNKTGKTKFALENYFFITLLLLFIFQPIATRFYVWITPFLALQIAREKSFWKITVLQLLTLIELRLSDCVLLGGIMAPLHYTFSYLPIPDAFISPFINIAYVHKFAYRLYIILTIYMLYRVWKSCDVKKEVVCYSAN